MFTRNSLLFVLLFTALMLASCSDDDLATSRKVEVKPRPAAESTRQMTSFDVKKYEAIYSERSQKRLPMTMGMLKSTVFSSYMKRYGGALPCFDPRVARLTKDEAILRLKALMEAEPDYDGVAESRSIEIHRLANLIRLQPKEYSPFLIKASDVSFDTKTSFKDSIDDLMYVPFAPNAGQLLAHYADTETSSPSLAPIEGFGAEIFLPQNVRPDFSESDLPKGTKFICVWFTGTKSTQDYCCSCSMHTSLEEDCGKYSNSCQTVSKCCSGGNAFWNLPLDHCTEEGRPIVDPRVWLDTTEITKIDLK